MKAKFILLLLFPLAGMAQSKSSKEKVSYSGSYMLGIIAGKAYTTFSGQIIQGIQYKNYTAGIGVAIDPYAFRTIPLFAHISYAFKPAKNSVYTYVDGGISIPWNTDALPVKYPNTDNDWHKLHSGLYAETGIGYRIALNKRNALLITMGYSFKRFKYDEMTTIWNGSAVNKQTDKYTFDYNRLTFRLGFSL